MIEFLVSIVLIFGVYLWWQAQIEPMPEDELFEVRESEPLRLNRDEQGWVLTAFEEAVPVALRAGLTPETLDVNRAVAYTGSGYRASAVPRPDRRYFYEVELANGQVYRSAERWLPLQGTANFRDLGGYTGAEGKRVAWGRVFRSDDLSRLTAADLAVLKGLGLRTICDLRHNDELKSRPDRVPEGCTYRHIPVFPEDPIGRMRVLFARQQIEPAFKKMYRKSIIDEGAPALGEALRLVANPANLPLLLHCTTGKDRTGISSALLLHICGVPRETIIADYSLTNVFIQKFIELIRDTVLKHNIIPGFKLEQTYPLLSARPANIERAFAYIEAEYGSVDAYLRGPVGLREEEIEAIRRNLLVEG